MRLKYWLIFGSVLAYFAVWLGFGFAYRSAAENSHGTAFSFNSDILAKTRIAAFKAAERTQVDDGYIQAIFDNGGTGFQCTGREEPDVPGIEFPVCVKPLGVAWALYYVNRFEEQGFTSFRIEESSHIAPPYELTDGYPVLSINRGPGPVKVVIYPEPQIDKATCCFAARLELSGNGRGQQYRLISALPIASASGRISEDLGFIRELAKSYEFPDGAVDLLNRIIDYETQYLLADFLYFSAVTISTLGYGDVLPNSQSVRILVMIETLLGAVTFGAFISSAFMA